MEEHAYGEKKHKNHKVVMIFACVGRDAWLQIITAERSWVATSSGQMDMFSPHWGHMTWYVELFIQFS